MHHVAEVQEASFIEQVAAARGKPLLAAVAEVFAIVTRCLAIGLGFTIPISTAGTSATFGMLVVCWLLTGDYAAKYQMIRRNRVALLAIALFGTYAVGLTYTTAPLSEAAGALLKYRRLLCIPVLVTIYTHSRARDYTIRAFELAMLITLVASFLMWWGLLESGRGTPYDCAVFKNHITQNILMAFFVAVLANRACQDRRYRWIYVGIILLAVYNILFMVGGRTGYVVLSALVGLFMFQRRGLRGLALAATLVIGVGAAAFVCSGVFRERVTLVAREVADYYNYRRDSPDSSVGERLAFYRSSVRIASQSPLIGTGTGSFRHEFAKQSESKGRRTVLQPHNEYLNVLVQTGVLGLSLFLYWLYTQWAQSKRLPRDMALLAQAVLVTFVVGSLFNSLMSDTTESHVYCHFIGLCFATFGQATAHSRPG